MTADPECLALASNEGETKVGLRMTEITFTKPAAFTSGLIGPKFTSSALPNDPTCNLTGAGTFNWLLQLDTVAGTIKTGTAKPVADATMGYAFDDETIMQGTTTFNLMAAISSGQPVNTGAAFATATPQNLVLAVWLDPQGSQSILLPVRQLTVQGTTSANGNCIGSYNAAGLSPDSSCQEDGTHPTYLSGGTAGGFIDLEDADNVIIEVLQQSLCVLLSGDVSMYGEPGMNGTTVCKRDASNKIVFQGDWCSTTNSAGTPTCADGSTLALTYAASGILITN